MSTGIDVRGGGGGTSLPSSAFGRSLLLAADAEDGRGLLAVGEAESQFYRAQFGQTNGVVVPPWYLPTPLGPELWTIANFYTGGGAGGQNATASPSITANGVLQTVKTFVPLNGNPQGLDLCYRVSGIITNALNAAGWAYVMIAPTNNVGTVPAGANAQLIASNANPWTGEFIFEFKTEPSWPTAGTLYLKIELQTYNNVPSGTLSLSNMSVRQVAEVRRPMLYTSSTATFVGKPAIYTQHFNVATGKWQVARQMFGADGSLTHGLGIIQGIDRAIPWNNPIADATFGQATQSVTASVGGAQESATHVATSMRSNNNDQILEVLKQDAVTWELRGNTHNGETNTSGPLFEVLQADGTWATWSNGTPATEDVIRYCRRFRVTWPTKITRSAPDNDDIATVTHVTNFYPDGIARTDRTTTFLKDITLRMHIDWMSSHDLTVPQLGRLGRGVFTLDELDGYAKVATPGTITPSTSAVGGNLPAGTYRYTITALGHGGESLPAAQVTQVTTGATSTVTLSWVAVANATGYRIYGRYNDTKAPVLIDTVGPLATSWIDDYSKPASGQRPPTVSTARRYDTTTLDTKTLTSDAAQWTVWRDLPTGFCYGHIFDRDSIAVRSGVSGVQMKLQCVPGTRKQYVLTFWTGGQTITVPSGTAWSATHWSYVYLPQEPEGRWEQEIALRATDIDQLKTMYPLT